MRTTLARGITHFSYTPLLAAAAAVTFAKLILYAALIDVAQFGSLGKMLLVSAVFGIVGSLGVQSVASRDLPALLARGRGHRSARLLAQTAAVTTLVALGGLVVAASGLSLFGLEPRELSLGILHGWAQSVFLTVTFDSRSRLHMHRYSRDTAMRSAAAALAGVVAASAGLQATGILVAEIIITAALFGAVGTAAASRSGTRAGCLLRSSLRGLPRLPWRAALLLLAGSVVGFASMNLDRWIAAERLERDAFGNYSFAWLVLVAAQSVQGLLNSGLLPLLARRCAQSLEDSALRLTRIVSLTLLAGGLLLVAPTWWSLAAAIEQTLPRYLGADSLIAPLLVAAALRVSDFWSSLLIVLGREGLVLAVQTAAVAVTATGFAVSLYVCAVPLSPLSLAWLACATAALSHAASAAGVYAVARGRRGPMPLTS